ncbi:transposase, partial [Escherichia coli]|uniref:transposase n=1 Tax=Escherichia coli TaxID=562 RepID=UPI0025502A27
MIDVLGPEKRRRRTTQEKIAIVQQSFEPGMTVSLVARQHGVLGIFRPKTTKCSGGRAVRGLQRGITFR